MIEDIKKSPWILIVTEEKKNLVQCYEGIKYLYDKYGEALMCKILIGNTEEVLAELHNYQQGTDYIIVAAGTTTHMAYEISRSLRVNFGNKKTLVLGVALDCPDIKYMETIAKTLVEKKGGQIKTFDETGSNGILDACIYADKKKREEIKPSEAGCKILSVHEAMENK